MRDLEHCLSASHLFGCSGTPGCSQAPPRVDASLNHRRFLAYAAHPYLLLSLTGRGRLGMTSHGHGLRMAPGSLGGRRGRSRAMVLLAFTCVVSLLAGFV